jgi:hypothetical protein
MYLSQFIEQSGWNLPKCMSLNLVLELLLLLRLTNEYSLAHLLLCEVEYSKLDLLLHNNPRENQHVLIDQIPMARSLRAIAKFTLQIYMILRVLNILSY